MDATKDIHKEMLPIWAAFLCQEVTVTIPDAVLTFILLMGRIG
jgi:hypothetical protein